MASLVPIVAAAIDATTSGITFVRSSSHGTPSVLTGAQMPNGTRWLLLYNLSYGMSSNGGVAEVRLATSAASGANRGRSDGEGNDHGTPEASRCSHLAGFLVHDSNGDSVDFAYRNVNTATQLWVKSSCPLVGIPLDDLVEGQDYWQEQEPDVASGDTAVVTTTDEDVWHDCNTMTITVSSTGYVDILAMMEAKASASGVIRRARVRVSGSTLKQEWYRESEDSGARDWQDFMLVKRLALVPGSYTVTIQGAGNGTSTKTFYRPRLFAIREGILDQVGAFGSGSTTNIASEYPTYTSLASVTYTPNQSEQVVVLGNTFAYRKNSGTTLTRLRNTTDDVVLSDLASDCSISGTDQDRVTHFHVGVASVSGAKTFALEGAGETGYGTTGIESTNPDILVWSMTINSGPPPDAELTDTMTATDGGIISSLTETITDGMTATDVLPLEPGFGQLFDTMHATDLGPDGSVPLGVGEIPVAHPRLLLNPAMGWLDELRAEAGYNSAGVQTNPPGSAVWQVFLNQRASNWECWHYALKWLITKSAGDYNNAILELDQIINANDMAPFDSRPDHWADGCKALQWMQGDGLGYHEKVVPVALTYDWLYDVLDAPRKRKCEDFMLATTHIIFHQASFPMAGDFPLTLGVPMDTGNWATASPYNNHFYQQIQGAVAVAIALKHHQPTDWAFPPGGTTRHQFIIPWINSDLSQGYYTDLWEWVKRRVDEILWPHFDVRMRGGCTIEGSNYGWRSHHRLNKALLFLWSGAGLNYYPNHLACRDNIYWMLYFIQPGGRVAFPLGEMPQDNRVKVYDYERVTMGMLAQAYEGEAAGNYAQWWLENVYPYIGYSGGAANSSGSEEQGWDFAVQRTRPGAAVDYRSVLPPYYATPLGTPTGTGCVHSRSSWDADAVAVNFRAGHNNSGHAHADNLSLCIFKGGHTGTIVDGWLLTDVNPYRNQHDESGDPYRSHEHNTFVLFEPSFANGWFQRGGAPLTEDAPPSDVGYIRRFVGDEDSTYWWGDASTAYYVTRLSGTPAAQQENGKVYTRMSDVVHREVMHVLPGYVVVYDRLRVISSLIGSSTYFQARWHFARNEPTSLGSGVYRLDHAGNRLFCKTLLPASPTIAVSDINNGTPKGFDVWQMRVNLPMDGDGYERMLTFFQAGTTAGTAAITETATIQSATFEGITIKDATQWHHCLFVAAQDGATPTSGSYTIEKNDDTDQHRVAGFTPGAYYHVEETQVIGSAYQYSITPGNALDILADAGGRIQFTPEEINFEGESDLITDEMDATDGGILTSLTMTLSGETMTATAESLSANYTPVGGGSDELSDIMTATESTPVSSVTETLTDDMDATDFGIVSTMDETANAGTMTAGGESLSFTFVSSPPPVIEPGVEPDIAQTPAIDTSVSFDADIDTGKSF